MKFPLERYGWFARSLMIVGAVTALRWVLLAFNRTDLFVDETQYWLWGQHFALGYYSKPPLIAWLIGAITTISGSDTQFWVRMPGAALHGLTALILAALAAQIYGARQAVLVAAAYVTLPMVAVGSLLISTDSVMAPFFAAALFFHYRLMVTGAARFAVLAGVAAGVAFLAKYVALYFLVGVALGAVFRVDMRISGRNTLILLGAFGAVAAPNIVWNLSNNMSTLSHTLDNIGWIRNEHPMSGVDPLRMIGFVLSQFALTGPVLFGAVVVALIRPAKVAGLLGFVWPALVAVSIQALFGQAYANWAASAFFAGTIVAVAQLAGRRRLLLLSFAINATICLFLPLATLVPRLSVDGQTPLLARYLGRESVSRQIINLAQQAGRVPVIADDRGVLADLFYTGRDSGLSFYAVRPEGRPGNHYELYFPAPETMTGKVLLVSALPPDCGAKPAPVVLDTVGGAYAKRGLSAYLTDAECLDAAR